MARGISDTCRDDRCLIACQKQHTQNDPGGQVDIPAIVKLL